MNLQLSIGPLIAWIAGVLILAVPRLLNFIVAIYLLVVALRVLFGAGHSQRNEARPAAAPP